MTTGVLSAQQTQAPGWDCMEAVQPGTQEVLWAFCPSVLALQALSSTTTRRGIQTHIYRRFWEPIKPQNVPLWMIVLCVCSKGN